MLNILAVKSSKAFGMQLSNYKHLQLECSELRQSLLFLKEENVMLKNRLADVLKNSFDENLLEEAESFNNDFIREDQRIHLLRNDLAMLDNLLEKNINGKAPVEIQAKINDLRNNITIAEDQFEKMQRRFRKFYEKI